jgi:hypothetical protein
MVEPRAAIDRMIIKHITSGPKQSPLEVSPASSIALAQAGEVRRGRVLDMWQEAGTADPERKARRIRSITLSQSRSYRECRVYE